MLKEKKHSIYLLKKFTTIPLRPYTLNNDTPLDGRSFFLNFIKYMLINLQHPLIFFIVRKRYEEVVFFRAPFIRIVAPLKTFINIF